MWVKTLSKTQPYPQTTNKRPKKNKHTNTQLNPDSGRSPSQPSHKRSSINNKKTRPHQPLLIGTKIGKCDLCKKTTKILLLRYGFTLCEECLTVCTNILDQINLLNTPPSGQHPLGSEQTNQSPMEPKEASL
jgi:hypothetical protein